MTCELAVSLKRNRPRNGWATAILRLPITFVEGPLSEVIGCVGS